MKRCPITYEEISSSQNYSSAGLKLLSPLLHDLTDIPLTAQEQRQEAQARVGKISIQGVQPKYSAVLDIKKCCFDIVDQFGQYILKPQHDYFEMLPENEALTMTMATIINLDVPMHG